MDKLAYHYNKKKLPGKTPGSYLYYYPCKRKEQANARLEDRSYIVLEVTSRQWEMLIELDRLEYNSNHAYSRHSVRMPDWDEDVMPHAMRERCIDKGIPFSYFIHEIMDKESGYAPPCPNESKPYFGSAKRKIAHRRKRQKNSALRRDISPVCSNRREKNVSTSKTKTHREMRSYGIIGVTFPHTAKHPTIPTCLLNLSSVLWREIFFPFSIGFRASESYAVSSSNAISLTRIRQKKR